MKEDTKKGTDILLRKCPICKSKQYDSELILQTVEHRSDPVIRILCLPMPCMWEIEEFGTPYEDEDMYRVRCEQGHTADDMVDFVGRENGGSNE